MKKIILNFILFLIMFFAIDVNAAYKVLCEYDTTVSVVNDKAGSCTSTDVYKIYVQVGDEFGTRVVTPQSCNFDDCKPCNHTFTHDYKNLQYLLASDSMIVSESAKEKFKAGECPKIAMFDLGGAIDGRVTDVQVCFGEAATDCMGTNSFEFVSKKIPGSITVTQTSEFVYGFVENQVPKGIAQANSYIQNTYKIDANKSWEDNTYCQQLDKAESKLSDDIKASYDTKFWEYISSQYEVVTSGIQEALKWRTTNYYQKQGDSLSIATSIMSRLRSDCEAKLRVSNLSDEEKEESLNRLNDNFNTEMKNLNEYFKGNSVDIDLGDFGTGDPTCEGFLGDPIVKGTPAFYLALVMRIIKYIGIILCLVFSIIDFLKAITSQDQDLLKKAIQTSVKRLIYAIIIFFLPILINFILGLVGAYSTCIS